MVYLSDKGWFGTPAFYRLSDTVGIEVPISRYSSSWDQEDVDCYEEDLLRSLLQAAERLQAPVILIDAGADIGIFSLKIASRCSSVERIIAFEPNSESYVWLKRNLDRLPYPTVALCKAVSDFEGRGELRFPAYDPASDHACYLEQSASGPIEVVTIDSVNSGETPHDLVLKLDLEGGEPAALRGALASIRKARNAIVVLEAHPAVVERIGIDPVESLRVLAATRRFSFLVGETGQSISIDRPVFEQISRNRILNIIGITPGASAAN